MKLLTSLAVMFALVSALAVPASAADETLEGPPPAAETPGDSGDGSIGGDETPPEAETPPATDPLPDESGSAVTPPSDGGAGDRAGDEPDAAGQVSGDEPVDSPAPPGEDQLVAGTGGGLAEGDAVVGPAAAVVTPEIETILPDSGALTGGDTITITGTDLDRVVGGAGSVSAVFFGGSGGTGGTAGQLLVKTSTALVVLVPRGAAVGAADVTLVTSSVRVTRDDGYTYLQPSISSVTPPSGPTSGGQKITISGVGFGFATGGVGTSAVASVTVGGTPASAVTRVNSTTVTATVPASSAGAKDVVVTVDPIVGANIVITRTGGFNYVVAPAAPSISTVSPPSGPTAGGNVVTVTGTNLRGSDTNPATITFGGSPGTVTAVSGDNKTATVTVPARAAGVVNVVAETSDGRATLVNGYEFGAPPTISSVAPASGPTAGGTRITINGTNFGSSGDPDVLVGGTTAVCVERVSATQITAVVPAGALGAADVEVVPTTGGGSVTSSGGFTYVAPSTTPTISSISPSQGPSGGGTAITITGTGLASGSTPTVLINGECAASVTGVSATSITATTPAGDLGDATVQITTDTGSVTNSSGAFRYVDITGVSPASGPTTGSTTITISGAGFGSNPTVTVGGAAATVSSASDTSIVAVTPPGTAGNQNVVVTPDGAPALTRANGFRYLAPTVTSVSPASGLLAGGTTVTVVGSGFGDSGTPAVTFGGRAASGVSRTNSTRLTAVVPAGAVLGAVDVVVTPSLGTGSGTLAGGYTYAPPIRTPLIDSVTPDRGPNTGGTLVTVLGANFRGSNNTPATVTLGGQAVVSLSVAGDGNSLTFTTPALSIGNKNLVITTNEGVANFLFAFSSVGPPIVDGCSGVSPRGIVLYTGSNVVTVSGEGFGESTPTVSVNGVAATVSSSTDSSVTFTIPAVPLGSLDIIITPTTGGPPLTLNDCITLKRSLTITAVATPSSIDVGDPSAAFSFTTAGLQPGDAVASVAYSFTGTGGTSYGPSFDVPSRAGTYSVAPTGASFSSGSASNYVISYVPTTYTINGIPATVTANDKTIDYGDSPGAFTASATGLQGSDALGEVTYTFSGSGYGPSTTPPTAVGTYTITPSVVSLSPGNVNDYSFTATTGTFTIETRAITVTPNSGQSKVYDGLPIDPDEITYTIVAGSLVGSDTLSNVLTASGTNAGTYPITKSSLADSSNPNYDISVTVGRNFTITRKPVVVTADAETKTYGDPDPMLTYTTSPDVGGALSGELTRASGETVGNYGINQGTVTNDNNPNYNILFISANLTIEKRAITVTADDQFSDYLEALPTNSVQVTEGSMASGESVTGARYAYSPVATPVNVGTYTITPSEAEITGGDAFNYDITYGTGTLTISPITVTVTPDAGQSKAFGASDPTFTYTLSEAVAVSGALGRDSGEDVGTYDFTIGTLSATSDDYELELDPSSPTFAITPKPVTVTAQAQTKTYGEDDPTLTYTTTPDVGDALSGSLERNPGEDVATSPYAITQGSVTDATNPNYNITYVGANLTITQAAVTVTPDEGQSKEYGDADPTLTYTASPDVPLDGELSRAPGENVGDYLIDQGTLTSTPNYAITFAGGADFGITTRAITIAAEDKEAVYDTGLPANSFAVTAGSLVNGDTLTGASVTYSPDALPVNAGTYTITPSNAVITGGGAGNYDITYVDGELVITPATLTVTPNSGQSKVFDDLDPTLTYTTSPAETLTGSLGREPGENVGSYDFTLGTLAFENANYTLELADPSPTFAITAKSVTVTADRQTKTYGEDDPTLTYTTSPDVGDALSGSLDRDAGEDVGDYPITQGTVTDATNPNYTITYVGADLTITKASVEVTPDEGQSKEFGEDDPTLTYTASPDVPLEGELSRVSGQVVGTYAILQGTLVSDDNYEITFTTGIDFEITTRAITISADDQEITYGDPLPVNDFSITAGSLFFNDRIFDVSYAYDPTATLPNAGTYAIIPSNALISGAGAGYYDITYDNGTLVINPADATVTAADKTIGFGDDPGAFSSLATGLLGSDALGTVTYSFSGSGYGPSTTPPTAVGTYTITPGVDSLSPGDVDNYDFTPVTGTFTITDTTVGGIVPRQGTYLGGTPFTITGTGFGPSDSDPSVTFGGEPATGVVWVNTRTITGITPPFDLAEEYTAEEVDVEVSVTGGTPVTLFSAYTYLPPRPTPVMQTLFPDEGPTVGNTPLTITGENLGGSDGEEPTVLVNGVAATSVTVNAEGNVVDARTPPGPPGPARDVELFTNEGAMAFLSAYTYIPPAIDTVSPTRGYEIGGTTVVVTGIGFGDLPPTVTVGGVPAQVVANSPTSVTIVTPPGPVGPADIVVVPVGDPDGATEADGFAYVPVPRGDVNGLLWLDLNKNGVYNPPEEPAFPNLPVTVTLEEYVLPPLEDDVEASVRMVSASMGTMGPVAEPAVVGAPVTSYSESGTTDAAGRYSFADLPYGRYVLTFQLPPDIIATYEPDGARDGVLQLLIQAPENVADAGGVGGSSLFASVVDSNFVLFRNTDVILRWWGPDQIMGSPDDLLLPTRTNDEGLVEFVANLPGGEYRIERYDADGQLVIGSTLMLNADSTLSDAFFIFPADHPGRLPATGADGLSWQLFLALALLLGGSAMLAPLAVRRRQLS